MSTEVYYWPDNEWCYGSELHQMAHKSDDYTMIEIAGESWEEIDEIVRVKNAWANRPIINLSGKVSYVNEEGKREPLR